MSDQFAPEYIRAIAPYQAGKPISEVAREFGLDENRIIKLASNENPLGMPESAKKAIANEVGETGRYPDANGFALKKVIGERYGIAQDWITLGNGSNDIIELAARTFVQQGQSVVFSEYSFLVYALVAKAIGAKGIQVPSKEYGHDLDAMLKAITADTRLLFLANPNNPTGTFLQPADIEAFLDKVINIDQSPIGRTPRSNPATYTGLFDMIRDVFAQTTEAKVRGYQKGRFSFNVKGGRCEACSGDGIVKIEMHFLPDIYVPCEVCHGKRYNRETLEVKYKGKTISDVLDMTVEEALQFFENIPRIKNKLQTLYDVGLSYVQLGQSSTTLSGGEAQRVKLATELSRKSTGKTVYILDEPTTGLHTADVHKLVQILQRLTEGGNTVIVIEHNLDVIKTADYIIDLGPEGGDGGGTIVAVGTPEEICRVSASYTGKYLKPLLDAKVETSRNPDFD